MSRSPEYKAIKNYIHNELGVTKEDIIKEIKPLLRQLVHQYMRNTYGDDNNIEGWIRCIVADEIKRVSYNFVKEMYATALKKKLEESLEIVIRPKEDI